MFASTAYRSAGILAASEVAALTLLPLLAPAYVAYRWNDRRHLAIAIACIAAVLWPSLLGRIVAHVPAYKGDGFYFLADTFGMTQSDYHFWTILVALIGNLALSSTAMTFAVNGRFLSPDRTNG
jgi:ABC-type dipeptide/oligopeptide/nickel transport system permease subunit